MVTEWNPPEVFRAARVFEKDLGGSTSSKLLIEGKSGGRFITKLPTAKFGCQLLVNEFLAGMLLERIGLPVAAVSLIDFSECDFLVSVSARKTIAEAESICFPLISLGIKYLEGTVLP